MEALADLGDRVLVIATTHADALKALADEGTVPAAKVAEAIKKYGIDTNKVNPVVA